MIEVFDCLSCHGRGKFFHICSNAWLDCKPCSGTGKQTRDKAWEALGVKLRSIRLTGTHMSLGEMARRLGVRAVELCDAEMGRSDPWPLIERAKAVRR